MKKTVITILIFIILHYLSGCVSSRVAYEEPETLTGKTVYKISILYLKDGNIIHLEGKESSFKRSYKGMFNVIIYKDENKQDNIVELDNVSKAKITVYENDVLGTVLIIAGSLVLAVLILISIFPFGGRFNIAG